MVPLVLGTTLLVFALGRLAPGDPVQILFGDLGDATAIARARARAMPAASPTSPNRIWTGSPGASRPRANTKSVVPSTSGTIVARRRER